MTDYCDGRLTALTAHLVTERSSPPVERWNRGLASPTMYSMSSSPRNPSNTSSGGSSWARETLCPAARNADTVGGHRGQSRKRTGYGRSGAPPPHHTHHRAEAGEPLTLLRRGGW